jgi:hypothetical protein
MFILTDKGRKFFEPIQSGSLVDDLPPVKRINKKTG